MIRSEEFTYSMIMHAVSEMELYDWSVYEYEISEGQHVLDFDLRFRSTDLELVFVSPSLPLLYCVTFCPLSYCCQLPYVSYPFLPLFGIRKI